MGPPTAPASSYLPGKQDSAATNQLELCRLLTAELWQQNSFEPVDMMQQVLGVIPPAALHHCVINTGGGRSIQQTCKYKLAQRARQEAGSKVGYTSLTLHR